MPSYVAGWSRQEIAVEPRGHAMHGYGMWGHRARGKRTALYARAFWMQDAEHRSATFCCLDLGYVTYAMREGVCARLRELLGAEFDEAALVLTATHTHSGPGGCAHEAMYNLVTPGFVPAHLDAVIDACVAAIVEARRTSAPAELGLSQGLFDAQVPVAWNRSLRAYNRNPDVEPRAETQTHLALDRAMAVVSFRREGRLEAFISLFGVHATCVGNTQLMHDGDNKGYAAAHAEAQLQHAGVENPVAIFAQATAGDVSPYYQGPGDLARRARIQGDAEVAYAQDNGRHQSERALGMLEPAQDVPVGGPIDAILSYVDFTQVHADARFAAGHGDAWTSDPCHGAAFFRATRIDGPSPPLARAGVAVTAAIAKAVRAVRLNPATSQSPERRDYYRRLYAAQGPKEVLLESATKQFAGIPFERLGVASFADPSTAELVRQAKRGAIRNSPMVPTVLPLQIVVLGALALVCCPGEFTTTAGRRVVQTVQERLQGRGVDQVLICTYCNDYMGYVTTHEEYQEQCYEGGHTIFGQWTLAAFQTCFEELAGQMLIRPADRTHDRHTRPPPVPPEELALRTNPTAVGP